MDLGPAEFRVPDFSASGGMPANIEWLAQELERAVGMGITGFAWLKSVGVLVKLLDDGPVTRWRKDYYDTPTSDALDVLWNNQPITREVVLALNPAPKPAAGGKNVIAEANVDVYEELEPRGQPREQHVQAKLELLLHVVIGERGGCLEHGRELGRREIAIRRNGALVFAGGGMGGERVADHEGDDDLERAHCFIDTEARGAEQAEPDLDVT